MAEDRLVEQHAAEIAALPSGRAIRGGSLPVVIERWSEGAIVARLADAHVYVYGRAGNERAALADLAEEIDGQIEDYAGFAARGMGFAGAAAETWAALRRLIDCDGAPGGADGTTGL